MSPEKKDQVLEIEKNHSQKRKEIPNIISQSFQQFKSSIDLISGITEDSENIVIKKLEYILESIYFTKGYRSVELEYIKSNLSNYSDEDIENIFNKYSNQLISGDDWQKICSISGLYDWSMGKSGNNIKDRIDILSTISYYSVDATLRTGIQTGLFLQNIGKLFPNKKEEIFNDLMENSELSGGLALTELSSGTNLLKDFDLKYKEVDGDAFEIKGKKHFQGLSDEATFWIVLAENDDKTGQFKLFIVDTRKEDQNVHMTKERDMIDLDSITYGVNDFHAIVKKDATCDIGFRMKEFQSMLFDSRMQFPAMIAGCIERIYDECNYKAQVRDIGGKMIDNPIIQNQLSDMKNYSDSVGLLNEYLIYKEINLFGDNYKNEDLSIISKTLSTEYMKKSGDIGIDLNGGLGFEKGNIVRQMTSAARPFTRFEGVNEMLYSKLVRLKRKYEFREDVAELVNNKYGINIQYNTDNKNQSDIYLLDLDDSQKGSIIAKVSFIEMIYEMGRDNEATDLILFLLNEIGKELLNAKNIKTTFSL